uniref:BGL01 n=1 Tax=Arundo donax TaxID=35708 RepID=A0A0A9E3E8_ARUDO
MRSVLLASDDIPEPVGGALGVPLQRPEVHVHQAEPGRVPQLPLEVVQQGPGEVAHAVGAVVDHSFSLVM